MDIRQITPAFAVSPQIRPGDVAALAEAGFTAVICNRPDDEVSGEETSASVRAACEAAGLSFHMIPVSHSGPTEELIGRQRQAIDSASGPVFAYCRSGTRSCHVWALGRAGEMSTDDIIAAGARGGYDLSPMRPTLDAVAAHRSG